MVLSFRVVWIGAASVPLTVTTPVLFTVVANGALFTMTLVTPVAPRMLVVHEAKVWAVVDSVATPGAAGLSTTVAVKVDSAQWMPVVPPDVVAKSAVVPVAREADSTSLLATFAPPMLPVVRTATASSASAGVPISATDMAAAAAMPRYPNARMETTLLLHGGAGDWLVRGDGVVRGPRRVVTRFGREMARGLALAG